MNNWITILTFSFPHEAHMAKAKLESEGIEAFIKDELTAQVYSVAVGGVKLQVLEEDFNEATRILTESGYFREQKNVKNKWIIQLDQFTSKFPLIGEAMLEVRLLTLVAALLVLIIVPAVLLSMPSFKEKLTGNRWCIDNIYVNGKEVHPNSNGFRIETDSECPETMNFSKNGVVDFPGISSYGVRANWKLKNHQIKISKWDIQNFKPFLITDSLKMLTQQSKKSESFYYHLFDVKIKNNTILLESDSVKIYGHRERPTW